MKRITVMKHRSVNVMRYYNVHSYIHCDAKTAPMLYIYQ